MNRVRGLQGQIQVLWSLRFIQKYMGVLLLKNTQRFYFTNFTKTTNKQKHTYMLWEHIARPCEGPIQVRDP